ncbi:hypothetical protein NUM3379_11620 [Kineococcus sp. NUM-3379]
MSRARAATPATALVAAGCVLTACAQLPAPQPVAPPAAPPPVVTPAQASRIWGEVVDAVAAADAARDPALLPDRVTGPEQALRTARYTLQRAGVQPVPTYAADELRPQAAYVPRLAGWPRWVVGVTRAGPDQLPSLAVLRSQGPREPYRLTASPSLLSGATLPPAGAVAEGVEAVAADDGEGLAASPEQVAERYGDVLLRGAASEFATFFADDSYRPQVGAVTLRDGDAVRAVGGTYEQRRSVVPGSVVALRTTDGGALVLAAYDWTVTHTVPPQARAGELTPVLATLAGRPSVQGAARVSAEVLAFVVPPAGAGPVRVVAAESGPVAVRPL